ncbi:MAG: hypothetical protein HKN01_10480 [Acidimicrobiia bacterium]|nr:hypothetical protein [Acidimicrobiia bacterium]NNF70189.1 hypothetical protein [Acidimicrobiia bacterium]NNK92420.1 hypothetical protein [Acidimicrobiia bacterium]
MGQQPNIELEHADLPRSVAKPSVPEGWSPARPGELNRPEDVPWGGAFGTPGPDTGFVYRLLAESAYEPGDGERGADVMAALAAVAGARASHFGRAPTVTDVKVAALILGYEADGMPQAVLDGLAADRGAWFADIAHKPGKARMLVGAIDLEVLAMGPDEIWPRVAAGERLVAL